MVIYCSKALQTALKLTKSDMVKAEDLQQNDFYSWHGHIAKVDGRNVIVLMNDKTMYCMLFRNKLPRIASNFSELVKEAIPYTFEVGNVNLEEIDNYMSGLGDIVFAEKSDRQMTGNISRMILDMSYQWNFAWNDNETIQAYEAWEQNRRLRKIDKDYIVPFEEMLKALCGIE